jgi:hypothetical protein
MFFSNFQARDPTTSLSTAPSVTTTTNGTTTTERKAGEAAKTPKRGKIQISTQNFESKNTKLFQSAACIVKIF